MGSSIRNIRDQRFTVRLIREHRDNTSGTSNQKTYDAEFTEHSSNVVPPGVKGEPSRTDHKVDRVHEVVRDQLAPRIQTMSANAVLTDRREFYYYRRKRSGRRCSCFAVESSPDSQCQVCYGTGIVGGYDKFGTITEVLDFTTPNLIMVNCEPNFDSDTRPVFLRLKDTAKNGYIEAEFDLKANVGEIDTCLLFHPIFNRGSKVIAIDPLGFSAEIKECSDLNQFLNKERIRIRVDITKIDDRPIISHFMFRYKNRDDLIIFGDVPRAEEDIRGSALGMLDLYQELTIFFNGTTVTYFDSEDLLYRLVDQRKFKLVMVNRNLVAGTLTSTDTRARYLIPTIDGAVNKLLA